jgi:drug/metabolite transporter (DMT)-like permease
MVPGPGRGRPRRDALPALCLLVSLCCQVLSAGFGKQAALSMPRFTPEAVLANRLYLASLACLVVQSACWPVALRRFPLSFAYLVMSASYAAVLLMSALIFHEAVGATDLLGAALIVAGVHVVVRGRARGERAPA